MTIKQQGGIFGRNPTFNEVEASDLTVRASVPTITIADTDTTGTHILKASNANLDISADPSGVQAGSGIRFFVDGDEKVKIDSNGNLIISNSGNGIDFSATAGTGTSELFDDYEEGTWTPSLSSYVGTPTVSGFYTKIGNKVFLECSIQLDGTSNTSVMRIDNLPFSVNAEQVGGSYITRYSGAATAFYLTFDASNRILPKTNADATMTYNDVGASALLHLVTVYRTA